MSALMIDLSQPFWKRLIVVGSIVLVLVSGVFWFLSLSRGLIGVWQEPGSNEVLEIYADGSWSKGNVVANRTSQHGDWSSRDVRHGEFAEWSWASGAYYDWYIDVFGFLHLVGSVPQMDNGSAVDYDESMSSNWVHSAGESDKSVMDTFVSSVENFVDDMIHGEYFYDVYYYVGDKI